ncbi:hypothetical protein [Planctomicrobium sp. SH527]|uniref:hypothetical protein n=1 Tax=Planctomicrobium sp. SH527 TaxID=3448123 RepID=UPI003F5C09DC
MTRLIGVLFLSAFLLMAIPPVMSPGQDRSNKGFLDVLQVGQSVSIKEDHGRYEIRLFDGIQVGHKVKEIGMDYIVVEDIAVVTETRIPVYSMKSVIKLKVPMN